MYRWDVQDAKPGMNAHHLNLHSLPDVWNDFFHSPPQYLRALLLELLVFWTASLQPCTHEQSHNAGAFTVEHLSPHLKAFTATEEALIDCTLKGMMSPLLLKWAG